MSPSNPVMAGEPRFDFLPITEGDLPMMQAWLQRPHVAEWWQPTPSVDELREDYIEDADLPNATRAYIASLVGRPLGFIQCYTVKDSGGGWWPDETDPGARGIDQFLAEATDLNKGIGRAMIRAFVAKIFADSAVTVIQTDPSPDNLRAIRCYRAAGFEEVGEVITPDGPALLMKCRRAS